ncbi:unnamed protein product [Boreogadus saida]
MDCSSQSKRCSDGSPVATRASHGSVQSLCFTGYEDISKRTDFSGPTINYEEEPAHFYESRNLNMNKKGATFERGLGWDLTKGTTFVAGFNLAPGTRVKPGIGYFICGLGLAMGTRYKILDVLAKENEVQNSVKLDGW